MNRDRQLTEPRLVGTWKSDRRRTFKHFRPRRNCSAASLRKFKDLFGKMVVRWTRKRYQIELDGEVWSGTYKILARDPASVVIELDELR